MVAHAMILCVTLNPCLDKTLSVPEWKPGDNVRGTALRETVGGKGNNVARALRRLGLQARPATFLGGSVGARCTMLMTSDDGFDPLVVGTEASTREILTVRSEITPATAFFDPDPIISEVEAETLLKAIEQALTGGEVEAITLSGSSPGASTHGLFSDMIALARARKIPAFLDTYGPSLEAIWGFWPEVMQLNRREAGLLLRKPSPSEADLQGLLENWARRGVKVAVVTDGPAQVLARVDGRPYRVLPPKIDAINPIGSGDCLLAGLVSGFLEGLDPKPLLSRGVASAVANALIWDAGAIEAAEVRRIEAEIVVEAG
jgi:1-phosphofructokinase family hexose kinase